MSSAISELFGGGGAFALRVALAVGAIAFVVTGGLALQVLALRGLAERRRRLQAQAVARWRPLLLQAASGDAVEPPRLERREEAPLLLLWNQLQDGLRGRAHEGLNRLGGQLGLPALARRLARRRHGGARLLGLRTLGHLGDPLDWTRLEQWLHDPRSFVSLAAARALLQIDATRAAPLVLGEFLARNDWPLPRLGTMLREAGSEAIGFPLAERLLDSEPAQQVRLLPLARMTEVPGRGSVVEAVLAIAKEPPVLAATLQQVFGPAALPRVRELTLHEDAQVRAYAALALGRVGEADDRRHLVAMLADRDWWVRYRAAQALLALPAVDEVDLEALRAGLVDRYARDMLEQVIAERGYAGARA